MPEFSASVTFFPLFDPSVFQMVSLRGGGSACDCVSWRPDCLASRGMVHKVFRPPTAEQDNAAHRGFLKAAVQPVGERQPGGERKEESYQQRSFNPPGFPLLFTSCLQIHTQRTVAASLSCTPLLHTSSVFPFFLSSSFCSVSGNADFWFHTLTPVPPDL